jgi:hypothetical protein
LAHTIRSIKRRISEAVAGRPRERRGFDNLAQKSAKAFPLPANDRVGLDVQQGTTPVRPETAERDPKQSIEARENGSRSFSLESRELQSQGSVLENNGLVTAQQQSNEPNERQKQG